MRDNTGLDWEDAFANGPYIDRADEYPALWARRAAAFRESANGHLGMSYGAHPRETLDLFLPAGTPKGLIVFIHGGFWQRFDKSYWSDLAEGALAAGWAFALPSYVLAPAVPIPAITGQIAKAISCAADHVAGPIRLTGHSAGGHLATRMICQGAPLAAKVQNRIDRVISISGLHDLRPLCQHSMNKNLCLDVDTAFSESPALLPPLPGIAVTAWVGACERPEFLRQSALLVEAWGRQGVEARLTADPGRHHFDVIDGLKTVDHPMTRLLVEG